MVESGITIENLSYNKDSVGDVVLNSHSHGSLYKMDIDGTIKNGLINDLVIAGNIDLTPGNDKIDLVCTLKETNVKPFEIFTEGLFSNINGLADGIIRIKGPLSKPDIEGKVALNGVSLFMDYLGLPLKVDKAFIKIDDKKIDLGTFKVKDKYGSEATAGGKIYHTNFQ
jgi:autotransporter translocation and assembly factor TamB